VFGIRRLLPFVWFVIGVIVAASNDYLDGVNTVKELASAVLAIVLWPLVLLDINLRIK
jgi:hypothetical protein